MAATANGHDDAVLLLPLPPLEPVAAPGHQRNGTHSRHGSLASLPGQHSRHGSVSSTGSRVWTHLPDEHLNSKKSLVTGVLMADVRELLSPEDSRDADDRTINQFLRATRLDAPKAAGRLQQTLAWRRRELPHTKLCRKCLQLPRAHYMQVVGYSKRDQPIIYSCFNLAKDRDHIANREHMLVTFEQAIRAMPPHVEQWVWVCDFHGFGLRDCNPKLARAFLEVSSTHYPERLALFLCVSAPALFSGLWRLLEPAVDADTRRKIRFATFDAKSEARSDKLRQELATLCEPGVAAWLLAEMRQNRADAACKRKVYPYGKVHAPEASCVMDGHDSRGCPEWIETVHQDPGILLPSHPRLTAPSPTKGV